MTASQIASGRPPSSPHINREPQIDLVKKAIKAIQVAGPIFQTVYEFTGIPGIGKTILIALLYEMAQKIGIPIAHLDFDPDVNSSVYEYARDPVLLLHALAEQLNADPDSRLRHTVREYSELPISETYERDLALEKVVYAFRAQVEALSQRNPPLFLFDTTDQASPAVLTWLEERLVSPLSQKGRTLFVFAGRSPLHWSRFEVRRRVHSERLEAFESQSIKDLLAYDPVHPGLINLSEQIYDLTAGYPLGSSVVQRRLGQMLDQGETIDNRTFPTHEPTLLDDLVREAIDAYVFRDVETDLANACRVLALLRQFDVILLRRVLSEFVPDFKDYPRSAYGGVLSRLHVTQVIEWDEGRKGYNVAMPLRWILSQYMRQHDPKKFVAINRAALEVYQDWVERVSENRSVYIIEALFHQAAINQVGAPWVVESVDLGQQLQEHLARCYTLDNYENDQDLLDEALNRLQNGLEHDAELRSLLQSRKIKFETLHKRITTHRRQMATRR